MLRDPHTGLVSFLLGHVAFIFAFYHDGGNSSRLGPGVSLYLYAVGIVYVILSFGECGFVCVKVSVGVCLCNMCILIAFCPFVPTRLGNIREGDYVLQVGIVVYALAIATMCHRSVSEL